MVSALFNSFRQCQKQARKGTLLQTSELYIWCIYPLLEECRPYVFIGPRSDHSLRLSLTHWSLTTLLKIVVSNSMMSVKKEKIGSEKKCVWQRETGWGEGSKTIWAMHIYTDHFSKRGFPYPIWINIRSTPEKCGWRQLTKKVRNLQFL